MDDLFAMDVSSTADVLTVSFHSWEGPLDLLLTLARSQKVDLREISILALVQQYLDFIENARTMKLEVAADYLVMAAWLAYLKSGLLLPKAEQEEPSPEDLALRLQMRLQRLAAMRDAAARLMARDRVGRDVFRRGAPEGLHTDRQALWRADYFDLLEAYGQVKARTMPASHVILHRPVMTLDEAMARVSRLIGARIEWARLEAFLPRGTDASLARSALASSFVAILELARQGRVDFRQDAHFEPIWVRGTREADGRT